MAQGALPFQYEAETAASGVTALGGLPVYLDLVRPELPMFQYIWALAA